MRRLGCRSDNPLEWKPSWDWERELSDELMIEAYLKVKWRTKTKFGIAKNLSLSNGGVGWRRSRQRGGKRARRDLQDVADAGAVGGHPTRSLGCGLRFEVERVDDLVGYTVVIVRRLRKASSNAGTSSSRSGSL